jgi:hypothetical protein
MARMPTHAMKPHEWGTPSAIGFHVWATRHPSVIGAFHVWTTRRIPSLAFMDDLERIPVGVEYISGIVARIVFQSCAR